MQGVRGHRKTPGEFRRSQNWIGGTSLIDAVFIPPHHEELPDLMSDLEKFWHNQEIEVPHLIRIAISHYQFETIHPFLDGNGRIGRLLIVLQLVADGVLREPMLYPSLFFKRHRALYYELLNAVRLNGDWERWMEFFAEGIEVSAMQGVVTANALLQIVNEDRDRIAGLGRATQSALTVHSALQRQPIATSAALVQTTGLTAATVNKSLGHLNALEIVNELTSRQRGRVFSYRRYIEELTTELEPGS